MKPATVKPYGGRRLARWRALRLLFAAAVVLVGCGAPGTRVGEVGAGDPEHAGNGDLGETGGCDAGVNDTELRVGIDGADLVIQTGSRCGGEPVAAVSVTLTGRVYCRSFDDDQGFEVEECNQYQARTDSLGEVRIPVLGPVFEKWGYAQVFTLVACEGCTTAEVVLPPALGAKFLAQNVAMDSSQWLYQYEQWLDLHGKHPSKPLVKEALKKLCKELRDTFGEGGPLAVTCYRDPDCPWECDQEMYEESLHWDCGMFLEWDRWFDEPYTLD